MYTFSHLTHDGAYGPRHGLPPDALRAKEKNLTPVRLTIMLTNGVGYGYKYSNSFYAIPKNYGTKSFGNLRERNSGFLGPSVPPYVWPLAQPTSKILAGMTNSPITSNEVRNEPGPRDLTRGAPHSKVLLVQKAKKPQRYPSTRTWFKIIASQKRVFLFLNFSILLFLIVQARLC